MMTRETVPVLPPVHPPGAGAGRGETVALVLLLAVAAWFYFWTATSAGSPLTRGLAPDDLYNRLADGFLAGRTSFAEDPPPELAALADPYDPAQNAPHKKFHDVSYYRGRYYLYFGPVPALVLLAPWKLVTGSYLPQNMAAAVFAWGAAVVAVLMVREVRRRYFPATGPGLMLAMGAAAVFGTLLPLLLRRPLYYELAIASACFLGLLALWLLLRARLDEAIPRAGWLAGAGLCLGLTVGARPNYLFGAGAVVAFCLFYWWRRAAPAVPLERLRRIARPAGALLLPFAACGLALAAYNLVRFGSITEFGTSYMLAGGNQSGLAQTAVRYVPINLYYYLVAPPQFSAYFPFVQVIGFAPFATPAGYSGQENTYGMALALPALWAIGLIWAALRRDTPAWPWQPWARLVAVFAAGNAAFLLLLMGAANRYMVDFVPPLMMLALLGVMHGEAVLHGWRRWLLRAGWGAALAVTLVFNIFVSLQHNELLAHHNPAAYRRLAHAFNHWSQWWPAGESGPLRIDLTLPANRTGKLEPLVVTGLSFRADFLYIFYKDDTHIQIGFEHTSYGGPMSPPLEVDYDVPHVLEVQMGSLFPPFDHPEHDGKSPEEITRLKRTLLVRLDGRVVHSGQFDFYDSSPGDVSVGRNPVSDAFGRRFTGVVRSVTRPATIGGNLP